MMRNILNTGITFFRSKTVVFVSIITFIILMVDSNRLKTSVKESTQEISSTVPDVMTNTPILTESGVNKLTTLYKKYFLEPPKKVQKERKKVVVVRPSGQEGLQNKLFTDKYQLSLRAVIKDQDQEYVLLEVFQEESKKVKLERFYDGQELDGYQIRIVNNRKVDLIHLKENRLVTLVIFTI